MKLIEPKVELMPQGEGILGVYKMIEIAGRTCYKSEDKITDNSCKEFVQRMINSGHTAMLEHGTVYLKVPADIPSSEHYLFDLVANKYTSTVWDGYNYITTNLRVLVENDWIDALKYISHLESKHNKRVTVRFTCDRGVSHELVRHKKLCVT